MDIQSRLIAPCVSLDTDTQDAIPIIPTFLQRLLVFEIYIFQTVRFKEFLPLVRTLGVDNVVRLLKSDALKLQLDPAQIMQTGQSHGAGIRDKPPLPALSYSFSLIRAANYNQYLVHNLQELRTALHGYISSADLRKLEEAIIQALLPVPETSGFAAITHHQADLRSNSPLFKKALACALRDGWGLEVSNIDLVLTIAPIDETDYKAISNLETLGLNSDDAHMAIQSALLAVGNVNSRIEDMKDYEALSGAIDDELSIFGDRFEFLASTLSPAGRERRFEQIMKVHELPSFSLRPPDRSFDVERFLEVRSGKECSEFRARLRTMEGATDDEIVDRVGRIRSKLGPLYQSGTGKGIRIALSTAIGLVPFVGGVISATLSVLDSFVLEKLLSLSGPTLFLSDQYPSLFKKPWPPKQ